MKWKNRKHQASIAFDSQKVFYTAGMASRAVFTHLQTSPLGLTPQEAENRQSVYGKNEVVHEKKKKPFTTFIKAFINPFIGVLTILVIISFVLDVLMAEPGEQEWTSIIVISTMVICSAILRFRQEWKASESSEALLRMVTNTCHVKRSGCPDSEISITELIPGDVILLAAGDMIPADVRIIEAKDLFVSQSSLTGESDPIEKLPAATHTGGSVVDLENICFMGSNVVSGAAKAVVFATGNDTYLGTIAKSIAGHRAATAFDKGISKVSFLLIRFMLVMIPFVFLINGITKGDWLEAFIFAVSVAVGLTPEMLPMIVTANLSKGAVTMAKKKTIVKDLNAIQNFGAMNILCTDKTGTLTCDQIVLEKYIHADGSTDTGKRILRHAYFNSFFQTGLKNLMDKAILSHVKELELEYLKDDYRKIDEIPFDFTRRRMSVVVEDKQGKRQIITKGALEEMLEICAYAEYDGEVRPMTPELKEKSIETGRQMNLQGMRVLAVAQRSYPDKEHSFAIEDEHDMVLIGFLAFLDPPKQSAAQAVKQLHEHGVEVKVLSGDNDAVVRTIARQVGIDTTYALTGPELEAMDQADKQEAVKRTTVFSKLTPHQKTEIIILLQEQQNTVGFLGDGINDAAALRQSDIGISVDSAVDIAKESADIILLEKDLMVLEDGVLEGRKTFGNITKYIKMTASSNFGNMFSVMAASALPADDADPSADPESALRLFADHDSFRPHGCRLSADAAKMGCLGSEPVHDLHRSDQFGIRHPDLSRHVESIRMQLTGTSGTFPVWLVHRRPSLADADRTHDPHAEDSFHPEQSFLAGHRTDRPDHGHRYSSALHPPGQLHRTDRSSAELLPVAGRNPYLLLRTDPSDQKLVYPQICKMAVNETYKMDSDRSCGSGKLPQSHGRKFRSRIHYRMANRFPPGSELGESASPQLFLSHFSRHAAECGFRQHCPDTGRSLHA